MSTEIVIPVDVERRRLHRPRRKHDLRQSEHTLRCRDGRSRFRRHAVGDRAVALTGVVARRRRRLAPAPLRRLTAPEYRNTIRDLFGAAVAGVSVSLPDDAFRGVVAEAQPLDEAALAQYREAARLIALDAPGCPRSASIARPVASGSASSSDPHDGFVS